LFKGGGKVKKVLLTMLLVITLSLYACGTDNSGEEQLNIEEIKEEAVEVKQQGDFEVSINVEENEETLDVYATITYLGEEDNHVIYHGGSIFFFNIYQLDGDFEYLGGMNEPLLSTTLNKDEEYKVEFNYPGLEKLKPGIYEFEAIADISLDEEQIVESNVQIPVSKIVEIK
jgi:hypothetical protein